MFRHAGTREIHTQRLLLRKFRPDDAPTMFANWTSDSEVARYTNWGAHEDVGTTEAFLNFLLDKQENADNYAWGIEYDGELVGSIDIVAASEEKRSCEVGYCLSRSLWNRGIMTEALRAVIDYLFENTDFDRVEAEHLSANPASGRVMQKAGMRFEGERPTPIRKDGSIHDMCFYFAKRGQWRRED